MSPFSCFRPSVKDSPVLVLSSQRDAADLQRARQQLAAQEAQIAAAREQLAVRQQQQLELEALLELKGHALVEALVQVTTQLESLDQSGQLRDKSFTKRHAAVDVDFHQPEHDDQDEAQAAPEARLLAALGRLRKKQEALQQLVIRLNSNLEASKAEAKGLEQQLQEAHAHQKAQEAQSKAQMQTLEVRCTALEAGNTSLTEVNTELTAELSRLERQLKDILEARSTLQGQGKELKGQLELAVARAEASEAELQATQLIVVATQQKVDILESSLASTKSQLQAVEEQAEALRSQLISSQSQAEEAQAASFKLRADLEATQQALQVAEAAAASAERGKAGAEARAQSLAQQLAEAEVQVRRLTGEVATAQAQAAAQGRELAAATSKLSAAVKAKEELEGRVEKAEAEAAAANAAAVESRTQAVAAKREVVAANRQLADMALDHKKALDNLGGSGESLGAAQAELKDVRARLSAALQEHAAAAERATQAESLAASLRSALDKASAQGCALQRELVHHRTLVSSLVEMSRAPGAARPSKTGTRDLPDSRGTPKAPASLSLYQAATSEGRLSVRLFEAPPDALGALVEGLRDSTTLSHLVVGLEPFRGMPSDMARLRVTCLAAALGLNTSLTEVELAGWTWSEGAYVGIAAPFLALGSNQSSTLAGSGGVGANGLVAALGSSGMSKAGTPVPGMRATGSGRVSMSGSPSTQMAVPTLPALSSQLTHVQIDTRLFDARCASTLCDLLLSGVVALKRPSGEGVLRLSTDHETLDEWYGTQIQHATTFPFRAATVGTSLTGAAAGSLSPASPTEAGLAMLAGSAANSPRHARHTYQAGSVVAALGFEGASSSSSGRREALGISEPGGGAGVMHHTQPPLSPASYHHGRSPSSASSVISAATAPPALAAARSNMAGMSPTGKSGAVNGITAGSSSLVNEGLEGHHMVLIMAVLITCPHITQLRLDGNKIGDTGADILSLGLQFNLAPTGGLPALPAAAAPTGGLSSGGGTTSALAPGGDSVGGSSIHMFEGSYGAVVPAGGLQELSLSRNAFGPEGARCIARALEGPLAAPLRRLDVSSQRVPGGLGPGGAEAFAALLRAGSSPLQELDLSGSDIRVQGAAALGSALRALGSRGGPTPLRRLHLGSNGLDAGVIRALQAAALECKGVTLVV